MTVPELLFFFFFFLFFSCQYLLQHDACRLRNYIFQKKKGKRKEKKSNRKERNGNWTIILRLGAIVEIWTNKKKKWKENLSDRFRFDFEGSTGGSLSPVTSLALNSLTGTPLNGLQDSLSNAYSSLQQYAGKRMYFQNACFSPLRSECTLDF